MDKHHPWLTANVFQRHCYVISKKALSRNTQASDYDLCLRLVQAHGRERVLTLSGASRYVWLLINGKRTKHQIAGQLQKEGIDHENAQELVEETLNTFLNFSPEPLIYPIRTSYSQVSPDDLTYTVSDAVTHFPVFFDATYILDTRKADYNANFLLYYLDSEVWKHLVKGNSLSELVQDITERFAERAPLERIYSLLAVLQDAGIIQVKGNDPSFLEQFLPSEDERNSYGRLPRPHYTYGGPKVLRFLCYTENPWYVTYETTYRCNLRCHHCYAAAYDYQPSDELDLAATKEYILEPLVRAPVPHVTIMGGEPLLRRELIDIIAFLRRHRTFVKLQTNGTLLTDEWAAALDQVDINQVEVSIDGIDATMNDRIRGQGIFGKALQALENLRDTAIPRIGMSFTVTNFNFEQIPNVPAWALEQGINEIFYSKFYPMGRGERFKDWEMTHEQREELEKELIPQQQREYPKITIFGIYSCLAGQKFCAISPKGELRPCTLHQAVVGDLCKQPFLEAWQTSPRLKKLRFFYREKEICNDCAHIHSCAGTACSAQAYALTGNMLHPECVLQKYGRHS